MPVTERDLPWLTRTSAMLPKGAHCRRTGHPQWALVWDTHAGTVGACQRSALLERRALKGILAS